MIPEADVTLAFGSRSGSWFALCLFAAMSGALGWGVSRAIRLRSRTSGPAATIAGLLLCVAPLALVYSSSLSGFYEAEVEGPVLRLHYLVPGVAVEIPLADVAAVRSAPWYRGRFRLQIVDRSGRRYESATWHRDAVAESAARLKRILPRQGA